MNPTYILFDLDGTLTDSAKGIIHSFLHTLNFYGVPLPTEDFLASRIGPPLIETFRLFNFPEDEISRAVAVYRDYFSTRGIYENRVYDHIPEELEKLKKAGKTLAVTTSKATVYAEKIIGYFGLSAYFSFVSGSEKDGGRSNKSEVIAYALESLGINASRDVMMIGDRKHDIFGAKALGVACGGVLYGYGSKTEIIDAAPDIIIPEVKDLSKRIMGL